MDVGEVRIMFVPILNEPKRFTPKILPIAIIAKKTKRRITNPVTPFITFLLALSTADLSPPEVIHWIPPIIIINIKMTTQMIKPKIMSIG